MLGMGVVFQMPAITYVLARIGLVTAGFLVRDLEDGVNRYSDCRGRDFADQRYPQHALICGADARALRGFDICCVDIQPAPPSELISASGRLLSTEKGNEMRMFSAS